MTDAPAKTMKDDPEDRHETRGRPVVMGVEERRKRVLDALDAIFARAGMAGLTMAAIAAEAGMSKRTLYTLFPDRAALFRAHLDRVRAAFVHPLGESDLGLPLAGRLRRLLEPDPRLPVSGLPRAVLRQAIAEADREPALARDCIERCFHADRALIRAELDRAVARAEATIPDTAAAAAMLQSMIQMPVLDLLLDPGFRPCPDAVRTRFELGLATFLGGIGAAV
ncbi:TetR family transcriptional regulator [Palleronia aestuarii]|uniref:TetR family transcriptional regulator n=1 Tax=Palleronia aestuarii TaxID=568105 RepID=A0A2W7N1P5_9RHOB|nr:TetR/AcrR family transcriptional regulator [Palleronia aestuarii]PZX14325.1 TetR family transcriptional regulator [Palleronia aestuarii]